MLAVVEAVKAANVGCKRRRSPAMAEEALQEKRVALPEKKKARLLVLQNFKMYVAAVRLKKGGWEAMRKRQQNTAVTVMITTSYINFLF
ncbi:hypothetical protein D5086_031875 [Populus alba]|uniref:Uncharacterized protein n=1 Tax=Populus alba TaxID=43335 RepID=A0ACC4AJV7_POPAL